MRDDTTLPEKERVRPEIRGPHRLSCPFVFDQGADCECDAALEASGVTLLVKRLGEAGFSESQIEDIIDIVERTCPDCQNADASWRGEKCRECRWHDSL